MFSGLLNWVFDLFTWGGGHNFLNSNPFLIIFSASDALIGEVQVLFGPQKQQSPPLGSGLPWALKWLLMGCSTLVTPPHTKVPACLYNLLGNLGPSDLNLQKMVYPPFAFYLLFEWILSPRFGVSLDWYAILCHYLILLCTNLKSKVSCYCSTQADVLNNLFIYENAFWHMVDFFPYFQHAL